MKKLCIVTILASALVLGGCATFPKPESSSDTMLIIPMKYTNTFGENVASTQVRVHIVNLDDSSIAKDLVTYIEKDWDFVTGLPEGRYSIIEYQMGQSVGKADIQFALESKKITILTYSLNFTLSKANPQERTVQVSFGFAPLTTERENLIMGDLRDRNAFDSWELAQVPPTPINYTFTLATTVSDYPDSPVTCLIFETASLAEMQKSPKPYSQKTDKTDDSGRVTFSFQVPRGIYLGWTVFKDINNTGILSSGDIVWGHKGGDHLYHYYWLQAPINGDVSRSYPTWEKVEPSGVSVWQ